MSATTRSKINTVQACHESETWKGKYLGLVELLPQ